MTDVCIVGSFMMDLVVRAPRRPDPGETLVGTSFVDLNRNDIMDQSISFSGKLFDSATACSNWAFRSAMVRCLP